MTECYFQYSPKLFPSSNCNDVAFSLTQQYIFSNKIIAHHSHISFPYFNGLDCWVEITIAIFFTRPCSKGVILGVLVVHVRLAWTKFIPSTRITLRFVIPAYIFFQRNSLRTTLTFPDHGIVLRSWSCQVKLAWRTIFWFALKRGPYSMQEFLSFSTFPK